MSKTICDGLTVVQFGSGRSAAMATMILAENGARVVRVEPPGGDELRQRSPSAFLVWDRAKESVVIDLRAPQGQARARDLAAAADVVVEAFEAGTADRYGIGSGTLRALDPRLIYCSIKGFPERTPYGRLKGYDGIVAAKTGYYAASNTRPGPNYSNFQEASYGAAHLAVQGVALALLAREKSGRGQHVEATLFQGLYPYDLSNMIDWHLRTRRPDLRPNAPSTTASLISERLCTKDGRWVEFMSILPHQFKAYIRALGLEGLWEDRRFAGAPFIADDTLREHFRDVFHTRFRERTLEEWLPALIAEKDLVFEPLRTCEEAMEHPQVRHNQDWVEIDDPRVGRMRQVGPLARFSATPSHVGAPAPALDQHGDLPRAKARSRNGVGPFPTYPLEGVTIVELANFYATPYALTIAAGLGARVIKIEAAEGDPWRFMMGGVSGIQTVAGKESFVLDLRAPAGQQVLHTLIAKADVFVYAFRAGVEKSIGADHETLSRINPRLIYMDCAGYGSSGPFAQRPMYGNTTKAMLGGVWRTAGRWLDPALTDGKRAAELKEISRHMYAGGPAGGDPESALGRATTLMLALLEQRRSGTGQWVGTSMVGLNAYANADDFNSYSGKRRLTLPDASCYGLGPLYRLYPAREGWVFLAAPKQSEFAAFANAAGAAALASDPRFATDEARGKNADALANAIGDLFATRTAAEWESALVPHGVGCVKVFEGNYGEFTCTDPAIRNAGLVQEVPSARFGTVPAHLGPITFSDMSSRVGPSPDVGQHTDAILAELGYDEDAVRKLKESKVVASPA